jgi:DNA mismatch repair protein MutL
MTTRGCGFFGGIIALSGKIHILPESLTNRIAAGEVIERPASIVKELLENAIDAGADDIAIELEKGGCGAVRIVDNGAGMDAEDVPLAFERYATSKIYRFDDIYSVRSFGFRGEALPSIASIARVEMTSRRREAIAGTKITVEAGVVKEVTETGCPVGTAVSVTRIFDPVPVRKKFLKAEATEQGACIDVIVRTALAHPAVRIKVVANKRDVLSIPQAKDAAERVSLVLGIDFAERVLPVQLSRDGVVVSGFISPPELTRSNSKQIYCYVNRRYVRDHLLNHAVMTAYRRIIEAKRYPAVVLFVDLSPEDVDVNVHPAKMEVRFRSPREIYDTLVSAAWGALSGGAPAAAALQAAGGSAEGATSGKAYQARVSEALKRYTISSGSERLLFVRDRWDGAHREPPRQAFPAAEKEVAAPETERPATLSDLTYLGQIAETYLVFAAPDGMVLVDQHAAHERVLFEKFKTMSASHKTISQQLLIPEVISLAPKDLRFIMESLEMLAGIGIEVEAFGGDAVIIKSVPSLIGHMEPRGVLMDILDEFSETERTASIGDKREKMMVSLACKAAVKANRKLKPEEVAALCRDLDQSPYAGTCPHGRPVVITLRTGDLEKMFKRK